MPFLGRAAEIAVESCQRLVILQLNVEGLTSAKLETIERIAYTIMATVILMKKNSQGQSFCPKDPRILTDRTINSKHHGLTTCVHADVTWSACGQSAEDERGGMAIQKSK